MSERSPSGISESELLRSAEGLRDRHRCPACLSPLDAVVCGVCGLNLSHRDAYELAAASEAAASALERRAELLQRIRAESVPQPAVPQPVVPEPAAPLLATTTPPEPIPSPAPPEPAFPAVPPAAATTRPLEPRRRSSVQIVLVIVGVSLLGVFAIFGLIYAFINYGIIARSLIVGGATLAAMITASILRSRGLRVSAEGIAALGGLLLLLDVWAVRENDLFGAGGIPPAIYWGAALLLVAVVFILWGGLSRLRIPRFVGHALLVPGVFTLVGGVINDVPGWDTALTPLVASTAGVLAAAAHRILAPRDRTPETLRGGFPERVVMGIQGLLLLPFAALTSLGELGSSRFPDTAEMLALLLVAVLGSGLTASLLSVRDARPATAALAALAAITSTATLVVVPLPLAVNLNSTELAITAPLLLAAVVALAAELVLRKERTPGRAVALASAITAISLGGVALLVALGASALPTASALETRVTPETGLAALAEPVLSVSVAALLGLLGVVLLAAVFWALGGRLRHRQLLLFGSAFLLALAAVPFARMHGVILLLWLVLAAASLVKLFSLRGRQNGLRLIIAIGGTLGALLAYSASWTVPAAWVTTSLIIVVLLVSTRFLLAPAARVVSGVLIVVVLAALGGKLVAEFASEGFGVQRDLGVIAAVIAVAAIAMIIAAAMRPPSLHPLERRSLFWVGTAIAVGGWGTGFALTAANAFPTQEGLIGAATATTPLVAWAVWSVRRHEFLRIERIAAAVLLAPALAATIAPLLHAAALPDAAIVLITALSATLVSAVALLRTALGEGETRLPADIGAAAVALAVVTASSVEGSADAWQALLPAALLALVTAVSRDGLIESRRPRKHLGWLSLALGTLSLWTVLSDRSAEHVEWYSLPPAMALLVIAALVRWRAPRPEPTIRPPSATYLTAAGLLIAAVPTAIAVEPREPVRAILIGAALAVALLIGVIVKTSAVRPSHPGARFVAYLVAAAGAAGLLAAVLARGAAPLELFGVGAVVLLSATSVTARLRPPAVGGAVLGWTTLALAALGALALLVAGLADPIESVTVPVAAALLLPGGLRLARDADRRSWPELGPGIAVAAIPSLLIVYVDDPAWRLIGVAVAALMALILGLTLRLQAPFVIGAVVLLWHLVTQFWAQLTWVYEALPWWLWLGIAGLLVIVIAVRYEQRLNNVKSLARTVEQLR